MKITNSEDSKWGDEKSIFMMQFTEFTVWVLKLFFRNRKRERERERIQNKTKKI